ncbi:hypothetical protein EV356DRAFT_499344 [Viridothelium virens]|uniref:Rhodopsin domain-containing protein n=1 Tax=Viridothelium virens TaxID=1048519 RepID=A0A6A6HD15_VIRVR|nr:hypothetical protein EV356DRAFT_499344 [Viridothelium virens]
MVIHILDRPENAAGWVLSIILTPICVVATALRFVATKRSRRDPGWEDWWALLALIFFIPYAVYLIMILTQANGRSTVQYIIEDPKGWEIMAPFGLMVTALFGPQQTFVKYSLLALYHRIFWVHRGFVRMVWIVAVIQGMWGLVVLLVQINACRPVKKSWYPEIPGYCINTDLFFSIYEPINSLLDFVVAGMAIYMLWKPTFRRNTAQVWWLSALFTLGAFSGILGIVKTVEAQNATKNNYLWVDWNLVQEATSIICCCTPIYMSLLPKTNWFSSISSWASRTFFSSHSKLSGGSSGATKATNGSGSSSGNSSKHRNRSNVNASGAQSDGASEHELVTHGPDSAYTYAIGKGNSIGDWQSEEKDGVPMRQVCVEHSVEVV